MTTRFGGFVRDVHRPNHASRSASMKIMPTRTEKAPDWASLLASYRKWSHPEANVLEIGASTRQRTQKLSELCRTLVGIELYATRIPANASDNVSYVAANWENLTDHIPSESVDLAVSSHVIEHVADDLKALNELYLVLKPGGTGLFNTPNRRRLARVIIELVSGPRTFPHGEHFREDTEQDLLDLLARSPFEKYEIRAVTMGVFDYDTNPQEALPTHVARILNR